MAKRWAVGYRNQKGNDDDWLERAEQTRYVKDAYGKEYAVYDTYPFPVDRKKMRRI